jgi:hypothetical protein
MNEKIIIPKEIKNEIISYLPYRKCLNCGKENVSYKRYYGCSIKCKSVIVANIVIGTILMMLYIVLHILHVILYFLSTLILSILYFVLYILHIVVSIYVHGYIIILVINRLY